jgi:hypothetical protein
MTDKISNLFQIQLHNTNLSSEQVKAVAESIKKATVKELLQQDFQIENLEPIFGSEGRSDGGGASCGGACYTGS